MKRAYISFVFFSLAIFGFNGCNSIDTVETKSDSQDDSFNILNETVYIVESDVCVSENKADVQVVKPQMATIHMTDVGNSSAKITVEYSFASELGGVSNSFSLCFDSVPYVSNGSSISFDAKDLTASCIADNSSASYLGVSVVGYLSEEKSTLSFEGTIHDYPFLLNIKSVSLSQESFIPQYHGESLIQLVSLSRWDISNDTEVNVVFNARNPEDEYVISRRLAPSENCIIDIKDINFPSTIEVEINYGDSNSVKCLGIDDFNSDNFVKVSVENKWHPAILDGVLFPYGFKYCKYSIILP